MRGYRGFFSGVIAACALCFAAPASAEVHCIDMPPGTSCTAEHDANQLNQLIVQLGHVNGRHDTIRLGPGTYHRDEGFAHGGDNGGGLDLIGSGPGTIIEAGSTGNLNHVIDWKGRTAGKIANLTVYSNAG